MGILVILGIIILADLFSDSPSGNGGGFYDSGGFSSGGSNNSFKTSSSKRNNSEHFEEDDSFYRVRDYSNKYSSNICFEGDTYVFTSFSSMMNLS